MTRTKTSICAYLCPSVVPRNGSGSVRWLEGEVRRFHALAEAVRAVGRRFILADEADFGPGWRLEVQAPIDRVYQQAAEILVAQVVGGPKGGAENPVRPAGLVAVR